MERSWATRRKRAGVLLGAAALTGAIVAGPQEDDTSAEIEATRATFENWVELRTQISQKLDDLTGY